MFNEPVLETLYIDDKEPEAPQDLLPLTYWTKENLEGGYSSEPALLTDRAHANLLGALQKNGNYRLLLDFDWGVEWRNGCLWAGKEDGTMVSTHIYSGITIPSGTPGHWHYYGSYSVDYANYRKDMWRIYNLGVLQEGFYNQIDRYGFCFLRPWWAKKGQT